MNSISASQADDFGRPFCVNCLHYRATPASCARPFQSLITGKVDFPRGVNIWQARLDYCGLAGVGFEPKET